MKTETFKYNLRDVAAAAGAGGAMAVLVGATAAQAVTVGVPSDTMSIRDVDLSALDPGDGFRFDLNQDGTDDYAVGIKGSSIEGGAFLELGSIVGLFQTRGPDPIKPLVTERLEAGTDVDGSLDFKTSRLIYSDILGVEPGELPFKVPQTANPLEVGETGFYGLQLDTGGLSYGWVEITRGSLNATRIGFQTVPGVAAPIPGGGPTVPVIPVPASLPLLAAGIGGIALLRRRKKAVLAA